MSVNLKELYYLHLELTEHLQHFSEHVDSKSRISLLVQGKPLIAKYFKISIALSHDLMSTKLSSPHLEATIRRYAHDTNLEAKKIIAVYIKYGHGCDSNQRLKFQMDIAEVTTLLKHRIKNEKEYLIPEYKLIQEYDLEHTD